MSLKVFHLVFIAASILMCLFVGAWGVAEYSRAGDGGAMALAAGCFALGAALTVYGVGAFRKLQELGR